MVGVSRDRDSTREKTAADSSEDGQSPPRPGVALVDPNRRRREYVTKRIGDRFRLLLFDTPETANESIDRSVAVLLLSMEFENKEIARLVRDAKLASPHVEVAIMAKDSGDLIDVDVDHDEELISPVTWEEFTTTIDSMIRRAQYSATLQRYFQLTLAANNRRIASSAEDLADDEQYKRLESEIDRLQARLNELTEAMDSGDYESMLHRLNQDETPADSDSPRSDPSMDGLPEECPNCGLGWGIWHGQQLGHGYERIAAFVWRCTDCDYVMANSDPNFRFVT